MQHELSWVDFAGGIIDKECLSVVLDPRGFQHDGSELDSSFRNIFVSGGVCFEPFGAPAEIVGVTERKTGKRYNGWLKESVIYKCAKDLGKLPEQEGIGDGSKER